MSSRAVILLAKAPTHPPQQPANPPTPPHQHHGCPVNMFQPRETVVIESSPPAYPGGYGTIDVHHHYHHTLLGGSRRRSSACCRAILIMLLILLIMAAFGVVCFVAWNFYNLSECEKKRLPWDKPCKDWLGRDSFD
ncbi:hypothetical protein BCR34DRAFT_584836 [Clohesyomyces aquaticus]|uniref:Uncharacterized protein n=1 Tax=Clohesyomyces aquaticus TaxID=1231657 RepID=A0A1Y2A063_9PLEO|nr:hypothetical protein BCR34DRAFT_584836 [Clohesyomyces aquaticus]